MNSALQITTMMGKQLYLLSLCVWLLKVSGALDLGETQLRPEGLVETQRANSLIGTLVDRVSMLIQTIFFFQTYSAFYVVSSLILLHNRKDYKTIIFF